MCAAAAAVLDEWQSNVIRYWLQTGLHGIARRHRSAAHRADVVS